MTYNEGFYEKLNRYEQQFKKDIMRIMDTQFIPRFTPKSKDEKYNIIKSNKSIWSIQLEKEKCSIVFYFFFGDGDEELKIQADVLLNDKIHFETNFCNSIDEVFSELMKSMFEYKIKKISINNAGDIQMSNVKLLTENQNENKEQIKGDIKKFIDNRFIPKFAPKSANEKYEIIEEHAFIWEIKLLKEGFTITVYFCSEDPIHIQTDIEFPDDYLISTNFPDNFFEMFDDIIKQMTEYKLRRIFKKN